MKKKFKVLALFLVLITLCVFCSACGVPDGYIRSNDAPIDYGANGYYFINSQFPEINANFSLEIDAMYFIYNDETYCINASGGNEWLVDGDYTIKKGNNGETIGTFVIIEKNKKTKMRCVYDCIFLSEDYLYYGFRKCFDKNKIEISTEGFSRLVTYYKYEFYRFDLYDAFLVWSRCNKILIE